MYSVNLTNICNIFFCRFYFDFSAVFVGTGMICSHLVNLSLLLGAVLSYGVMWPLLSQLKGEWFPESLEESDMKSLYGYKVPLEFSSLTFLLFLFFLSTFPIFIYVSTATLKLSLISLQVFLSVSLILGDGIYNFIKILVATLINIHYRMKKDLKTGNYSF